MEFWLQRGVDGFRVDTVNMYSKGEMLDAPVTDPGSEWQFDENIVLVHEIEGTIILDIVQVF